MTDQTTPEQDNGDKVTDGASAVEHFDGEQIANGAADALHGGTARVERYEQGGATELIGGTLIGDEPAGPDNTIGERVGSRKAEQVEQRRDADE